MRIIVEFWGIDDSDVSVTTKELSILRKNDGEVGQLKIVPYTHELTYYSTYQWTCQKEQRSLLMGNFKGLLIT